MRRAPCNGSSSAVISPCNRTCDRTAEGGCVPSPPSAGSRIATVARPRRVSGAERRNLPWWDSRTLESQATPRRTSCSIVLPAMNFAAARAADAVSAAQHLINIMTTPHSSASGAYPSPDRRQLPAPGEDNSDSPAATASACDRTACPSHRRSNPLPSLLQEQRGRPVHRHAVDHRWDIAGRPDTRQ